MEQGSSERHQNKKTGPDSFSKINCNTKISEKKIFSGVNLFISIMQVPKMHHNLLTCDFFDFGPNPVLQTLSGVNMDI